MGDNIRTCEICQAQFVPRHKHNKNRVCSWACRSKLLAKVNQERYEQTGHGNAWKGSAASYSAVHKWLEANLDRPEACAKCGGGPTEWANISGTYSRVVDDWRALCHTCNMRERKDYKLTFEIAEQIRSEYTGRYGEQAALARKYGVTDGHICNIVHGKTWRVV